MMRQGPSADVLLHTAVIVDRTINQHKAASSKDLNTLRFTNHMLAPSSAALLSLGLIKEFTFKH
jgi:hypothetical protein